MKWQTLEPSTKIILKVVLVVLTLAFLWAIRDILIVLLLSVILASAMEPMVNYLNLKRVPRTVSVLGVYIIVIAVVVGIISLIVPPLLQQTRLLQLNLPEYIAQLKTQFPSLNLILGQQDPGLLSQFFGSGDETVFSRTVGVFNGFISLITILVVSFYLVAEQKSMTTLIHSLVPPRHREYADNLILKIQHRMGMWIIGQLILSVSIFLLTYIGLSLLGVRYALFLALLAGLLEVIPYIGPFLAAVPTVFIALTQSPPLALAVALLYLLIQKTEGYILVPKVYQKTIGASPLIVLLALLIGFKLAGVFGVLLAVPLVGGLTIAIQELMSLQDNTAKPPVT